MYESNLNVFHVFTRLVIFSWGFRYTSLNAGTVVGGTVGSTASFAAAPSKAASDRTGAAFLVRTAMNVMGGADRAAAANLGSNILCAEAFLHLSCF